MKKEFISIIVPFLNGENYIANAIESILNQTIENFEILLIDNGSKDNSKKVIEKYQDKRIKYYYLDEPNVSKARNFGIDKAKGEFIYFMDGDDTIESNCLQNCMINIKKQNVDLIMFNFNKVSLNKKEKIELPWKNITIKQNEIREKLIPPMVSPENNEKEIMGTVWRIFTYSKFIKELKFNSNVKVGEDLLFCLELFCKVKSIYLLEDALYNYTLSSTSTLNSSKIGIIYQSITYHEILKKILIDEKIYNKDMKFRFYKNQGRMYTNAISFAVRNKNKNVAKNEIKNIINLYQQDNFNYLKLNYSYKIKLSFILMNLKMNNILYYIYKYKEMIRIKNYNK